MSVLASRYEQAKATLAKAVLGRPVAPVTRPCLRVGGLDYIEDSAITWHTNHVTGELVAFAPSLVQASRLMLRCGIKSLDAVISLDGRPIRARELLARAAAEHGEPATAALYRKS